GKPAQRETDTMDTFVCSSWYFLRFCSPEEDSQPVNSQEANYWMNVDQYVGGIEHAILHLLYAGFFNKALRDLQYIKSDEPFRNLLTQGMVVSQSYYSPGIKKYYNPKELSGDGLTCPETGKPLVIKLDKMSKSKNNGVDPDEMIGKYGVDTVRLFMLFAAPPERDLEWNEQGVDGCFRFLKRVYRVAEEYSSSEYRDKLVTFTLAHLTEDMYDKLKDSAKELFRQTHKTIRKVTEDFVNRYHFNTGIAAMMELLNMLTSFKAEDESDYMVVKATLEKLCIMLMPVTPHVAEEINTMIGHNSSLYQSSWPEYNPKYTVDDTITYVFQVNGKVRAKEDLAADIQENELKNLAINHERIVQWLDGKKVVKVIVVPKKLVNIVVK
ncbi:MAG: class I tRNA ligase family protein, partial [Spirochaetota bacterium]|nr:class I tRNA ligase family protein [Spirochaetota bacterium]